MTLLPYRLCILNSREGMHERLVIGVDGEQNVLWMVVEMADGEINGKELTVKDTGDSCQNVRLG